MSLVRKTKNDFFNNLNVKYITDKKTFLKVVKPYFSNKSTRNKKITLVQENQVITSDEGVAEKLSSYFETIADDIITKFENIRAK